MSDSGYPEEVSDWTETALWAQLERDKSAEADAVRTTLKVCMTSIQSILNAASTSPTDFTLHDAAHAGRVAQCMAWLMPPETFDALSSYELALLLLSAYLHDIGMTPKQSKMDAVLEFLLTGSAASLPETERVSLQRWLDDSANDVPVPLSPSKPTPNVLRQARLLAAHYCRHRHVPWASELVQELLQPHPLGSYRNWVTDLQLLCESHHLGFARLKSDSFSPKLVSPNKIVHLRYLAVLLRVADILDFDPKRTPEVIFQHRNVSPGSLIYWHKDHYVARTLDGDHLTLFAEPPDAQIHRAVEIMAQDIEAELRLAHQLDAETHYERAPFLSNERLPHRWAIQPYLHVTIRPRHDTYEYINGAFRPDTQKLLQLVSGSDLYSNDLLAIRELLQNAFDAVREQIAYERREQQDPASDEWAKILGNQHRVELSFERVDNDWVLVCSDDGAGMTKALISDHLLVSGTSRRRDIRELERSCRERGFELERTGQYGIGVLSYFMIAEKVEIHTRRSDRPSDADGTGWRFETAGIGAFGELRPVPRDRHGTTVRLWLRRELLAEPPEWFGGLRDFVRETVVRAPCRLFVRSEQPGGEDAELPPDWTGAAKDLTDAALPTIVTRLPEPTDILPKTARDARVLRANTRDELMREIADGMSWRTGSTLELAGVGQCRVHVPVFGLPLGTSCVFMRIREELDRMIVEPLPVEVGSNDAHATGPALDPMLSWKGMAVRMPMRIGDPDIAHYRPRLGAAVELDFASPAVAQLSLNREHVRIRDDDWMSIVRQLRHEILRSIRRLVDEVPRSPFSLAGHVIAEDGVPEKAGCFWVRETHEGGAKTYLWEPLQFPAVCVGGQSLDGRHDWCDRLVWRGNRLWCYGHLNWRASHGGWGRLWAERIQPHRIVAVRSKTGALFCTALWERFTRESPGRFNAGLPCSYPPKWRDVCGATGFGVPTWNNKHPLFRATTAESWAWWERRHHATGNPLKVRDELLGDRAKAATFLCLLAQRRDGGTSWRGLVEHDKQMASQLLRMVYDSRSRMVFLYAHQLFEKDSCKLVLHVFGPDGCEEVSDAGRVASLLPLPGPDWEITVE